MMIVSVPPALAWPVRLRLARFAIVWTGTSTALLLFIQQSISPGELSVFQPAGHVVLYLISQYWMNAKPELEYTNCCQPWHADGIAAPLQVEVVKKFELSWREKVSGCGGGNPSTFPLSLVTPVTLSKDPMASEMWPVTWAETSLPLPTMSGRRPPPSGG